MKQYTALLAEDQFFPYVQRKNEKRLQKRKQNELVNPRPRGIRWVVLPFDACSWYNMVSI